MNRSTVFGLIQVVDYNPEWPNRFCQLREKIGPLVGGFAVAIEHVGSTAVPGLAAKPVIDIDIIIPSRNELSRAVAQLGRLGYEHRGDLGIEDREAFWAPQDEPAHHLYVCPQNSVALRNHITLRNHLRNHSSDVSAYSALKKELAKQFPNDMDGYVEGKSVFILSILAKYGFNDDHLDAIRQANRR